MQWNEETKPKINKLSLNKFIALGLNCVSDTVAYSLSPNGVRYSQNGGGDTLDTEEAMRRLAKRTKLLRNAMPLIDMIVVSYFEKRVKAAQQELENARV